MRAQVYIGLLYVVFVMLEWCEVMELKTELTLLYFKERDWDKRHDLRVRIDQLKQVLQEQ